MKYRMEAVLQLLATHLSILNTKRQVMIATNLGGENEAVLIGLGLATKYGGFKFLLK